MNEFLARVSRVRDTNFMSFEYEYDTVIYTIEVPITHNNDYLEDGDIIKVSLGIATHGSEDAEDTEEHSWNT